MTKEKRDLDTELGDLKKEFETIKNSIEKITKGQLAGHAGFSYDNIEEMVSPIMKDLNKFLKKRKEDLCDVKDKFEDQISANPFLTIFGALAIGTAIGILIKKIR
jgi:ElaB/YqjD/DUF883 family membrane-anchored ribosome-binding protein